jgi:hypothetical protein
VREVTAAFLDSPLIVVDPSHIPAAIEKEDRYNISFWDALILAAAESGGDTEDLNEDQQYGGVLARNPFRQLDISLNLRLTLALPRSCAPAQNQPLRSRQRAGFTPQKKVL